MKKYILSIGVITTFLISSCGDESSFLTNVKPADGAKVKFIHAAPDAPGIAIYVNEQKVSGVLTVAPATPGTIAYGSAFPATDYAAITAGVAKVKVTAPSLSNAVVFSGDAPLESGKFYSVFATGLAPNYAPVVVQDNIPELSGNKVFIRLINLVPNSTNADISISGAAIGNPVAFGKGGDVFIAYELPGYTAGSVTIPLTIKINGNSTATTAGTVTNTLTANLTGYTPGRAVTVVTRGLLSTQDKDATGKIVVTASKYAGATTVYLNR